MLRAQLIRPHVRPMLLALALVACHGEPATPAPAATAPPPAAEPAAPTSANDAPAAMPATAAPDGDRDLARLDGYGPLRFGMAPDEMSAAWGGDLAGGLPEDGPEGCYHLNAIGDDAQPYLALMVDGGKFVRYSTAGDVLLAPGGGRRGMTEAELQALYGNSLQASPHEYVEGGKYLAFDTSGVAPSRLVFEVDARGRVTGWRVGLSPQVDYVEGCS